jgi:hypothetical protein
MQKVVGSSPISRFSEARFRAFRREASSPAATSCSASARNERIAERFHLGWWNRADELSDFTSVLEGFDRWNPLDLEGSGDPLVLVGVDLDKLNLAFSGLGGAVERRRQLLAWSAPRGPEVDDDGELPRLPARRRTGPLVNARSSPRNALSIAGPSSPTSGSASGSA